MKVAFISRSTLYTVRGGDTTQVDQTALHLRKLEVNVDIMLSSDIINYEEYDLLHFFNLIRPSDILLHMKRSGKPFVVSPIYVDYSNYDKHDRKGLTSIAAHLLGKFGTEYMKTLLRLFKGQDSLSSISYLLGHKRAMKRVLKESTLLLPNSENEARRIQLDLGNKFNYAVVPNAIDTELFKIHDEIDRQPNRVICVGQIEGRKNQHRLIEATRNLDLELVIIGRPSPNNLAYFENCKKIAHERVQFIDFLSQNELVEWYNSSAIHALPSWFETTGLTSLEAAACGCRLLVSESGDTMDYFDGGAEFCKASSTESIKSAIERSFLNDSRAKMQSRIESEYNWKITAKKTLDAYNEILG